MDQLNDMKHQPRIVILAEFPAWKVDRTIPSGRSWKYLVWLVSLYETLKMQQQYDIHWISFNREISRYRCVESGGQTFHFFPCGPLTVARVQRFAWDRWRARRLLDKLQPQLVHAWGTESRYAWCGLQYAGKKILSMQGVLRAFHERSPMTGYYWRLPIRSEKMLMESYDLVTCESIWGCERCREIAPDVPLVRWEYAANPLFFDVEREPAEKPYVLMAGTDDPRKNMGVAVEAFRHPALAGVELVGAGLLAEQHPDLPPNVKALGGVSHERIAELLSHAWGLVHPSKADTSPNIVKEARVVGLPVVTTTECGGMQYIEPGKSGYILAPDDVPGMVKAIGDMTQSRERSLEMGAFGWEECRRQLSPQTMYEQLMRIYDAVLHNALPEEMLWSDG